MLDNVNPLIYLLKTALLYLTITQFPVSMKFETREKLSSLEFCVDDIVKIMRLLDQNKFRSWRNFNTHNKTLYLLNIETIASDF